MKAKTNINGNEVELEGTPEEISAVLGKKTVYKYTVSDPVTAKPVKQFTTLKRKGGKSFPWFETLKCPLTEFVSHELNKDVSPEKISEKVHAIIRENKKQMSFRNVEKAVGKAVFYVKKIKPVKSPASGSAIQPKSELKTSQQRKKRYPWKAIIGSSINEFVYVNYKKGAKTADIKIKLWNKVQEYPHNLGITRSYVNYRVDNALWYMKKLHKSKKIPDNESAVERLMKTPPEDETLGEYVTAESDGSDDE